MFSSISGADHKTFINILCVFFEYILAGKRKPTLFMTIPRFVHGVPYSLAVLTNRRRANSTEVTAYPSYDWHDSHGKDCDEIISVYRVQIDECGRLWALDSGEIDFVQYCPPSIAVFDLYNNELIHRYYLPHSMYKTNISRFVTPFVDVADPPPMGECKQVTVYMADALGLGIVVYDMIKNKSWRIENKFTFPDPVFSTFRIENDHFELLDGVFALTASPRGSVKPPMLYFHALAADLEVAIPLHVVNNASNWGLGIASALNDFHVLGRRGTQCAATAMSSEGYWLCGYLEPQGLYTWNIRESYVHHQRLLAENADTLQFLAGLKVVRNTQGREEVWMLSNRLQKAFTNTVNYHEINYRIQQCGLEELLTNQPCQ